MVHENADVSATDPLIGRAATHTSICAWDTGYQSNSSFGMNNQLFTPVRTCYQLQIRLATGNEIQTFDTVTIFNPG